MNSSELEAIGEQNPLPENLHGLFKRLTATFCIVLTADM